MVLNRRLGEPRLAALERRVNQMLPTDGPMVPVDWEDVRELIREVRMAREVADRMESTKPQWGEYWPVIDTWIHMLRAPLNEV